MTTFDPDAAFGPPPSADGVVPEVPPVVAPVVAPVVVPVEEPPEPDPEPVASPPTPKVRRLATPPPAEAEEDEPIVASVEVEDEERRIDVFLKVLVEAGGSDLHIKADGPPRVRIDGVLRSLAVPPLTADDTEALVDEVIREDQRKIFHETNEADFAYQREGVGRFRVNALRQRGAAGMVFRHVAIGAPSLESLGVPPALFPLALEPRGLVLVTGPTGSGKTTTLAAMIDHINQNRSVNIVTIEDPIEVIHEDKMAMVNQREVGVDTRGFLTALRGAMRQDPDVILVGEMRDGETVKAALAAAETGHFVMSTLHTVDAQESVNRIIDFFPPHEQQQIRFALSGALRGILCQRLVPRATGKGRAVAMEIAINTGRIADAIVDAQKTSTLMQLVREGGYYGMQTFDQHLIALYRDGVITLEAAINASTSPHDMQVEMRRLGMTG